MAISLRRARHHLKWRFTVFLLLRLIKRHRLTLDFVFHRESAARQRSRSSGSVRARQTPRHRDSSSERTVRECVVMGVVSLVSARSSFTPAFGHRVTLSKPKFFLKTAVQEASVILFPDVRACRQTVSLRISILRFQAAVIFKFSALYKVENFLEKFRVSSFSIAVRLGPMRTASLINTLTHRRVTSRVYFSRECKQTGCFLFSRSN